MPPDLLRELSIENMPVHVHCVDYWTNEVGAPIATHVGAGVVMIGFCSARGQA